MLFEKSQKYEEPEDKFLKYILSGMYNFSKEDLQSYMSIQKFRINLSMKLGDFHNDLLSKFDGYEKLKKHESGCDLKTTDDTEYWEIKNSDKTMNRDSSLSVFNKLAKLHDDKKTVILVYINCVGNKNRFSPPNL